MTRKLDSGIYHGQPYLGRAYHVLSFDRLDLGPAMDSSIVIPRLPSYLASHERLLSGHYIVLGIGSYVLIAQHSIM